MHLMYVDESGDDGYPESGVFPAAGGPTRYFVRGGLIVHGWKWMQADRCIADFKRSYGLPWDVEIKASDLRARKRAFESWPPSKTEQFLLELLKTISREMEAHLLVVAIDKTRVDLSQENPRFRNPKVRSLELLLERYNRFLATQTDRSGIVILDEVEAKGDENLRYFHSYLLNFSEHLVAPRRIVEGTLFMPSHCSNLLQVADVCTNVMYRQYARPDGNKAEVERLQSIVRAEKVWP